MGTPSRGEAYCEAIGVVNDFLRPKNAKSLLEGGAPSPPGPLGPSSAELRGASDRVLGGLVVKSVAGCCR